MTDSNSSFMTQALALRDEVIAAKALIKQADDACYAAKVAAERACHQAKAPSIELLESLKQKYADCARELAIEADACPTNNWGGYLDPHEVSVGVDGVWLSWDINGDYAPAMFCAEWPELCSSADAAKFTDSNSLEA